MRDPLNCNRSRVTVLYIHTDVGDGSLKKTVEGIQV